MRSENAFLGGYCPRRVEKDCIALGEMMLMKPRVRKAEEAASLLAALGNAKRLMILEYLLDQELPVSVIAEKVSLSQSALSQHLAKLRNYKLVETRRDKQMIYYTCRSAAVRKLISTLEDIFEDRLV